MRTFTWRDLELAALNNQFLLKGTSGNHKSTGTTLLLGVFGATGTNIVTIKDKDGTTLFTITSDSDIHYPIRLEGGIEFTSVSACAVQICVIEGQN